MKRNLITRITTASAVVAALVVAVLALLVTTVRDLQTANHEARSAAHASAVVDSLDSLVSQLDVGRRELSTGARRLVAPLLQDAHKVPASAGELLALPGDRVLPRDSARALAAEANAYARAVLAKTAARGDVVRAHLDRALAAERARNTSELDRIDSLTNRAIGLAIGGLVATLVLIALLATYLGRYVVVPVRRVGRAARELAGGDLDARVAEVGDAETLELARSFNRMASSLQRSQDELAGQNALLTAQQRISRAVLDATPDPIGLFGLDGALVVENAPMAQLRGRVRVDAPGEDPEREVRDEIAPDGKHSYSRYAAPVRDATGTLMGRIVVLRDVTAERESERLKDEFFALVSHELRTPLTSIIGYLELVLDDEDQLSSDSRRFLEVVERNANRLLRLVGDVLFVAQIEAGRLSLERKPVDLGVVSRESVEAARPSSKREQVGLSLEAEPLAPIIGDADRLGQMVDNLVSNALKFTPAGGHVTLRLAAAGERAVLEVIDNGVGVPDDEREQLFKRFFRASNATASAIPGAGLGLTIVKTIVEAHGGRVGVRSSHDAGTTFRVELPYRVEGGVAAAGPTPTEIAR